MGRPDHRRGFHITAGVLAYISLDEATALHERTTEPLRDSLDAGGLLYWTWVLPALAAVMLVGLVFARFAFSLPEETRRALVLAGALFVACAIGLELLEGYFFDRAGEQGTVVTDLLSLAEETGEILAVVLTIRTVVRYGSEQAAPAVADHVA